jgi:outer membrane biosynthesis protein TonB
MVTKIEKIEQFAAHLTQEQIADLLTGVTNVDLLAKMDIAEILPADLIEYLEEYEVTDQDLEESLEDEEIEQEETEQEEPEEEIEQAEPQAKVQAIQEPPKIKKEDTPKSKDTKPSHEKPKSKEQKTDIIKTEPKTDTKPVKNEVKRPNPQVFTAEERISRLSILQEKGITLDKIKDELQALEKFQSSLDGNGEITVLIQTQTKSVKTVNSELANLFLELAKEKTRNKLEAVRKDIESFNI